MDRHAFEPSTHQWVSTASGKVAVDSVGTLFARIERPGAASVIIRAKALLVPGLTSDNLIPVHTFTDCKDCNVHFSDQTVAIRMRDTLGREIEIQSRRTDGLYPITLTALSETEMDQLRPHFNHLPGKTAQTLIEDSQFLTTPGLKQSIRWSMW